MPELPEFGAKAAIDTTQWDRDTAKILDDAARIDRQLVQLGMSFTAIKGGVNVSIDASLSGQFDTAQRTLNDLKAGVTSVIDFDPVDDNLIRGVLIDAEAGADANVQFKAEGEQIIAGILADARTDVTSNVKMNVSGETEVKAALDEIKGKLGELQGLAVIDLALNATEFISQFESLPIISTILDVDNAVHQVTGTVERELPGVGDLINNLYTNNWGESRDEVAGVIASLAQLRDENGQFVVSMNDLGAAAQGAFEAAAVGGEDTEEVIRAGAALVRNGLVPDFESAFDFISKGFASGLNSSDDFLDSIKEYSQTLNGAGLSANTLFNILEQGLGSGAYNTDKLVDAYKEFTNLTREEVSRNITFGEATDRTQALQEAGVWDVAVQYTNGDVTGDQFAQDVIDSIVAYSEDPATQRRLALAIFGPTMVEESGLDNLLVDTTEAIDWAGAGEEMSTKLFDTTTAAYNEFTRTLETKVAESFLNAVGGAAFLDKLKVAAVDFSDALQSGLSVGEALEVALQIPGLADFISRFESSVNNLIINILQAAANIGQGLGLDTSGLRKEIGRVSAGQLTFDLKVAETPEQITAAVQTAIERGVNWTAIQSSIDTSVGEVIAGGDLEKAQILIENLATIVDKPLSDFGQQFIEGAETTEEAITTLEEKLLDLELTLQRKQGTAGYAGDALNQRRQEIQDLTQDIERLKVGGDLNLNFVSNTLTEGMAALNTQLNNAIETHDWDLARTLGTTLNNLGWREGIQQNIDQGAQQDIVAALFPEASPEAMQKRAQEYLAQFATSISSGGFNAENYNTAAAFTSLLPTESDPEIAAQATALVNTYAADLTTAFDAAVESGDVDLAESIYKLLKLGLPEGDESLFSQNLEAKMTTLREQSTETKDTITADMDSLRETSTSDLGEVTAKMDETETAAMDLSNTITTSIPGAQTVFSNFLNAIGVGSLPAIGMLVALATQFSSIKDSITAITGQTPNGSIPGHAYGGTAPAGIPFIAGERGAELVSSDERLNVLNARSTGAVMSTMQAMLAGQPSYAMTMNAPRSQNNNYTFYTQSPTQDAARIRETVDEVRGMY